MGVIFQKKEPSLGVMKKFRVLMAAFSKPISLLAESIYPLVNCVEGDRRFRSFLQLSFLSRQIRLKAPFLGGRQSRPKLLLAMKEGNISIYQGSLTAYLPTAFSDISTNSCSPFLDKHKNPALRST